jgi:hypothetical protein
MKRKWISILVSVALVISLSVLSFPQLAVAATCTWTGATNSDWHTASNWSGGVPTDTDDVTIPNTGVTNEPTISSANVTIHNLTIEAGRTFTLSSSRVFTCTVMQIDSGATLAITASSTINVGGNWTNNGTFIASTSTVKFSGSGGTQTISGSTTFYNLTLNDTNATTDFGTSSTTIANNLTASAGTMQAGTSTVTFTGASGSIAGGNAKRFYNLVINSGANISHSGGTLYIKSNFTNDGTFTQNSSLETIFDATTSTHSLSGSGTTIFGLITINGSTTVNAGTHNLTVTGSDFAVTGTFNGGTATATFNGSTTLSGSGTISFNNVTINGTKSLINTNNKSFNISGNWINNGTYTAGTETVTFNKSGTQTLAGTTTFNNVTVNSGSTLQLAANANFGYRGTFTIGSGGSFDAITNSPTTVTIAGTSVQQLPTGATTLRNLMINSGSSLTAPSSLSIAGDFTNSGTFTHNNGTVTFNGSGMQNLTANVATAFYNLTVNNGVTLVETVSADNASIVSGGMLTNNGTIRKSKSVSGGCNTFGLTKIQMYVNSGTGTIQVDRIDQNHPNATGQASNIATGKYWTISGSGFSVNLTLPHNGLSNPKVCKYPGGLGGAGWDCARDTFDSTTVIRNNITSFSDWAVGHNVGSTAVTLSSFTAASPPLAALPVLGLVALGGLAAVATLGISAGLVKRRRA